MLRSKELDETHVAKLDSDEVLPTDNPWDDAPKADMGVTITLVLHNVFPLRLQGRTKKLLKIIKGFNLQTSKTTIQFLDSLN
jgi:hypothetical protein